MIRAQRYSHSRQRVQIGGTLSQSDALFKNTEIVSETVGIRKRPATGQGTERRRKAASYFRWLPRADGSRPILGPPPMRGRSKRGSFEREPGTDRRGELDVAETKPFAPAKASYGPGAAQRTASLLRPRAGRPCRRRPMDPKVRELPPRESRRSSRHKSRHRAIETCGHRHRLRQSSRGRAVWRGWRAAMAER